MKLEPDEVIEVLKDFSKQVTVKSDGAYQTDKGMFACRAAIKALEKQIPKKAERKVIKYGKHKCRKDKNGEIDDFAFDYGYHNGVVCEICGEAVCVHCNPDYDKLDNCEDNYYICPTCRDKFYSKRDYCSCGQKLDWSEEE